MKEYDKYLKLLKEKYPTKQSVYRKLINLNAIMNLPKGTEHFMSDLDEIGRASCRERV